MDKHIITELSLINSSNIDSMQLSNMTINTRFVDSTEMKIALDAINNNSRILSSILNQMDQKTDFLMSTKDIINQMIVTDLSTWYYDSNAILHPYPSLIQALNSNMNFEGRINVMTDLNITDAGINFSSDGCKTKRKIIIDFHDHTISCSASQFIGVSYGTELILQHGKFILPKMSDTASNEFKFQIGHGKISLKDIKIDADISKNNSTWNYRMFNISQQYDEFADRSEYGRSELDIDKDCEIDVYNSKHSECVIVTFSPYYTAIKSKKMTANQFHDKFGTAEMLMPVINIDGTLRTTCYNESDGAYPCIIGGNGSDKLDTIINITDNARLYAQQHGIYLGNRGVINITGNPIIIGGTGICMRSGKLNIPRNANPTIIGTGPKKEYNPIHGLTNGSDWGNSLDLGHAVILENNGPDSYGGCPVSADIQAGTFISYNNTAFGSYGIATNKMSDGLYYDGEFWQKYSYTNSKGTKITDEKCYFFERAQLFVDGIQTQRRESQESYSYIDGSNPDYNVSKKTTKNAIINAIKFENDVELDLTSNDNLIHAVEKIAYLLGAKSVKTGLSKPMTPQGFPTPSDETIEKTDIHTTIEIEDPDFDDEIGDSSVVC